MQTQRLVLLVVKHSLSGSSLIKIRLIIYLEVLITLYKKQYVKMLISMKYWKPIHKDFKNQHSNCILAMILLTKEKFTQEVLVLESKALWKSINKDHQKLEAEEVHKEFQDLDKQTLDRVLVLMMV